MQIQTAGASASNAIMKKKGWSAMSGNNSPHSQQLPKLRNYTITAVDPHLLCKPDGSHFSRWTISAAPQNKIINKIIRLSGAEERT